MKIALCVANLASKGKQGPDAYKLGFNYINESLLNKYDIDIFLHSYEPELKDELLNMYNPVDYLFEEIPDFIEKYQELNEIYTSGWQTGPAHSYQNVFSMMYSRYMVGQLKSKHEKKNNFIYDWVIVIRYDIFSRLHLEPIYFNPNLNSNMFYSSFHKQLNIGPNDQWFYSNSKNMDMLFSLFNELRRYFLNDSEFLKSAENGWINSNEHDLYSCEILYNTNSTNNSQKINIGWICNAHLIYKWFFYIRDLWNLENMMFPLSKLRQEIYMEHKNHPNVICE